METAALAFRTVDFPAKDDETIELYIKQLQLAPADRLPCAIRFEDPSAEERPELTRRLPPRGRVLDAGCGAGGGVARAKARNPGWEVVGIERDPGLAARARRVCDRVLEGDLMRILPELSRGGECFDALVFADVLEHLEDPIAALAAARRLAAPGAMLLVSVPNAGHISIVRDLALGRFDPAPAGLCDAGHLRWFTRAWLCDAIREAGWRLESVEGEAGAPAPEPEAFLALAAGWPDCDRDSLATYQWIATARAE
jgi:SAM-dependent methyltransferase